SFPTGRPEARPGPGCALVSVAMDPGHGSHRGPGRSTSRLVRGVGPSRRGRLEVGRMVRGLPGFTPGPSLGGPRVEGPTARRRDGPGPEGRVETDDRETPPWGVAGPPARLRYRV